MNEKSISKKTLKNIWLHEPSYNIRKFLDSQKIGNLTDYLEEMHKKGIANEDHTTLLLNCYIKLKNTDKLDEFIKGNAKFDVETAIKVLRRSGFFDEALYLASKHHCHDLFLKIQIDDKTNALAALEYMRMNYEARQLSSEYLMKYGRYLMDQEPTETTNLIKLMCEHSFPVTRDGSFSGTELFGDENFSLTNSDEPTKLNVEDFLDIFIKNSEKMIDFLEYLITKKPENATSLVYNTLLDIYLNLYKNTKEKHIEDRILEILASEDAKYDMQQVLISCQINHFPKGIISLYEKNKLYQLMLYYYINLDDKDNVIRTCERFGDEDNSLWTKAFWYFSRGSSNNTYIVRLLEEVGKRKLIEPVMAINILSKNQDMPLSVLKDYLMRFLSKESEIQIENDKIIHQYKDETDRIRAEIEDIKKLPRIFQISKCSSCNNYLELPAVHFLCNHSYHINCFENYSTDDNDDCPLCLPEHRRILGLIKNQDEFKLLHESFREKLQLADTDVFSIISNYFSKAIFNKIDI